MSEATLAQYGWTDHLATALAELNLPHARPARVIADFGINYRLAAPDELTGEVPPALLHRLGATDRPKVGDWVAITPGATATDPATIQAVLARHNEISRLISDRTRRHRRPTRQVLAVNIDLAFLVQSLDQDFSPQRLERYLFQLAQDHIRAVIILNKADKVADPAPAIAELEALGLPVVLTSATDGRGLDAIRDILAPGVTAVFLGSSGVGKSTITNRLLGQDRQTTQEVRAIDAKGRHTTSHRELFLLPHGGLIIDTPGLRELQLWGHEERLNEVFPDIEALAAQCQFPDCAHRQEPGCAVQAAIAAGQLSADRLTNYHKLQAELQELAEQAKRDARAASRRAPGSLPED